MQVLISEFVCGGGWAEKDRPPSLIREGAAMLRAIVNDAARIPNLRVITTWDARLGAAPFGPGVIVHEVSSPDEEAETFTRIQQSADRVLVIAPEFDEILASRSRHLGTQSAGSAPTAIRLCADKLALAAHFASAGVPTIPTQVFDFKISEKSLPFPIVVKPRDGAGSQSTYLIGSREELSERQVKWEQRGELQDAIWQPYFAGQPVSVAVFINPDPDQYDACPVCEQTLSADGRFEYAGGVVPARLERSVSEAVQQLAIAACRSVPGLRGYIGVDMIVRDESRGANPSPIVVEINPRLTTSYLGLRRLAATNLAEQVLGLSHTPMAWLPELRVRFTAAGEVTTE